MKPVCIYALTDPRSMEIKYVGKSVTSLARRRTGHEYKARSGRTSGPLTDWIRNLSSQGLRPEIILLDWVSTDWGGRERFWIEILSGVGVKLFNRTRGGNGAHTRAKLTAELVNLLGDKSDFEISKMAGLSREAITYHRTRLGIPPAPRKRGPTGPTGQCPHNKILLPVEAVELLGTLTDREIALKFKVSKIVVRRHRLERGIGKYGGPPSHRKGTLHHNAKLTPDNVLEIRRTFRHKDSKTGLTALARRYGVHPTIIKAVLDRKTWKHV